MAELSWWMFASAGFIYIVTISLLVEGAGLFRNRERPTFRFGTLLVVLGGVIAPIAAIIAIGISGVAIGNETEGDAGSALTIKVTGKQWWWEICYLDEAGETIAVTANELHLPVGEWARIELYPTTSFTVFGRRTSGQDRSYSRPPQRAFCRACGAGCLARPMR